MGGLNWVLLWTGQLSMILEGEWIEGVGKETGD